MQTRSRGFSKLHRHCTPNLGEARQERLVPHAWIGTESAKTRTYGQWCLKPPCREHCVRRASPTRLRVLGSSTSRTFKRSRVLRKPSMLPIALEDTQTMHFENDSPEARRSLSLQPLPVKFRQACSTSLAARRSCFLYRRGHPHYGRSFGPRTAKVQSVAHRDLTYELMGGRWPPSEHVRY